MTGVSDIRRDSPFNAPFAPPELSEPPEVIDLTENVTEPSLAGPLTKVAWAESHLQLFQDEWQRVIDNHDYTFIHEVHADGLNHRYRAVAVPELDPKWTLMLGDCAHNLRAALNYLAYELVRANNGKADLRTEFPAYAEAGGIRVQGGIADDAMKLMEAVQPYLGSEESNRVRAIVRLDRIHQQREISLVPCATARRITVNFGQQRVAPQIVKLWTSDRALESGNTVHGCEYITPYYAEDPHLKIIPHIVIEDLVVEELFGRMAAPELTDTLLRWVRDVLFPRFAPFFE